jgi:hypothetical protein
MHDKDEWENQLHNDIEKFKIDDPDFKICICSQSAKLAENLNNDLQDKYPNLKILKLTGLDSGKTKKICLDNINETLKDINVFIYSPVIESGVDITIKVQKLYGILSACSSSQRAFLQMAARCRNVHEREIPLLNDPSFKVNKNFNFWKFKEVEQLNLATVNRSTFEYFGETILLEPHDQKRKQISVYNTVEELNKNPAIYLNYLRVLAEEKGYEFNIDPVPEKLPNRPKAANPKLIGILNAKDLTDSEYDELSEKKSQGKTTTEENFAVEKHYWKKFFNKEHLDEKELVNFMYGDTYNNFLALIDINNHFRDDTLKSQKLIEKVKIVNGILEATGLSSIVDGNSVESKTFMMNFYVKCIV